MPTPTGWRLLTLGVAAVAGGRAFGILELYVIGGAAAAAVVTALSVRLVHPSRLLIRRRVSSTMVAVSEPLEVRLEVANRSRLPSPTVRVSERVSGLAEVRFSVAPVPGAVSAASSYHLQPARRGVLEIGPTLVEDVDGAGLARRQRTLAARSRVVVHPPIEQLVSPRLPVGGDLSLPIDVRRRSLGLTSEEFDVLRPYTEGDDLRHIHWRSTARLDELIGLAGTNSAERTGGVLMRSLTLHADVGAGCGPRELVQRLIRGPNAAPADGPLPERCLMRRLVQLGCGVLDDHDLEAAVGSVAGGGLDARAGRDAGDDEGLEAKVVQHPARSQSS